MQLDSAPIRLALEGDDARPARSDRAAPTVTLVGCLMTLAAAAVPWGEKATFGFSLASTQWIDARILLATLAAVSAAIAAAVILRRPAAGVVALVLAALAVAQIAAATWFGVRILDEVRESNPHLILINAIGTGFYMAGLGSATVLAGGIVAWTRRRTR